MDNQNILQDRYDFAALINILYFPDIQQKKIKLFKSFNWITACVSPAETVRMVKPHHRDESKIN